jgi:hypothetical protein
MCQRCGCGDDTNGHFAHRQDINRHTAHKINLDDEYTTIALRVAARATGLSIHEMVSAIMRESEGS